MKIEFLCTGLPEKKLLNGRECFTGICKKPVNSPLRLGFAGFEDDGVGDLRYHGGANKAVCVYSRDHYPFWEKVLGRSIQVPAFGENLSVSDMSEHNVCIGDIFRIGTALVQVSQPRQPCKTLAYLHARDEMLQLVKDSGYTGFYCRVLEQGTVKKGDVFMLAKRDPVGVTVSFASRIYHHEKENRAAIEKILSVTALSDSWQDSFLKLKEQCRK